MIIQSARKLFETKSYDDVSMEEIADEAAVSKQTLYNYFSNKDVIYFGVGVEGFLGSLEGVEQVLPSSASGRELVLTLSEDYFNSIARFPLGIEISRKFMVNQEINNLVMNIFQKRTKKKKK